MRYISQIPSINGQFSAGLIENREKRKREEKEKKKRRKRDRDRACHGQKHQLSCKARHSSTDKIFIHLYIELLLRDPGRGSGSLTHNNK